MGVVPKNGGLLLLYHQKSHSNIFKLNAEKVSLWIHPGHWETPSHLPILDAHPSPSGIAFAEGKMETQRHCFQFSCHPRASAPSTNFDSNTQALGGAGSQRLEALHSLRRCVVNFVRSPHNFSGSFFEKQNMCKMYQNLVQWIQILGICVEKMILHLFTVATQLKPNSWPSPRVRKGSYDPIIRLLMSLLQLDNAKIL